MSRKKILILLLFCFSFFAAKHGLPQFYNGSQMSFGKNRVQFIDRFWSYLRFDRYDVYYYKEGRELANFTAAFADRIIPVIEKRLDYNLENKIQFIVFNKYSDLRQSNIGLLENTLYNTGGITHIVGTKVFLFFDGSHAKLEEQIRYGIAEICLNELLYGKSYFSMIKNSTLMNFPDWYLKGLCNYIAGDWDADIDNRVRDGILSAKYKRFNRLEGQDAIDAGHSIWNYIEIKYGEPTIPNILYMSKINKNVENGFLYVIGLQFKTLIKEWYDYYYNYRYAATVISSRQPPDDHLPVRYKKSRVFSNIKISPDGKLAAYTSNDLGQYKVWIYNTLTDKSKKILKRENRLDENTDLSYPIIAWHPSGKILTVILEAKGKTWLCFYSLETRKLDKRPLYLFEKVLDFSYNDKGDRMVMSAVKKGNSDIFIYYVASNTFEEITNDNFDDLNPRFINNSKDIIFSSNRFSDTLKANAYNDLLSSASLTSNFNIFIYHYALKSNLLFRITDTHYADESFPAHYKGQYVSYLSDANGIINRYIAKLDSTVSFVDTIVHYRHFVNHFPATNNLFNIIEQNSVPAISKYSEIIRKDAKYRMFIRDIEPPESFTSYQIQLKDFSYKKIPAKPAKTDNSKMKPYSFDEKKLNSDSAFIFIQPSNDKKISTHYFSRDDTAKIDINNYKFSKMYDTRQSAEDTRLSVKDSEITRLPVKASDFVIPRPRNANVEFNINRLVNQLDFSYLNTTYQPFTGGNNPIFINPGITAFFQVGATDLFEDYRITGGMRLALNLTNNEYFVSFNNLKNRLDRELILHRMTFKDEYQGNLLLRERVNEALYILKYPFSNVAAIKLTTTLREDKFVYMSIDTRSLRSPDINNYWSSLKAEYVFDNSRDIGLNLFYGTRYKIFAEYFRKIHKINSEIFVIGFDFRHYTKIHRNFIWANRLAASSSIGQNKLIYYLGGVDTWLKPAFDRTINIDRDQNYIYQTLATPMRGFRQNIRNGNSFALLNSELRFPVFKYFIKRPIKSDFISNFQLIGFSDIGTAWTGPDPYSDKNALYTQQFTDKYITVTIKNQKEPIVGGFGFGLRSRLLGYFVRADWAWGIEDREIQNMKFYLSLSLDF